MTYEEILEIYNNPLNVAFKTLDNEIRYHYDLQDMISAQKVYDEILSNEDKELIDEAISLYSVGCLYCDSWLLDISDGEQSVNCSDFVNECLLMIGYYCDDKGFNKSEEYYHSKYGFEVCDLPAYAKCDFDLQNAYKDTLKGISYITHYEKKHTLVYHTYSKNENCFTDFIAPATKVFESENICDYDELIKAVVSVAQKFGKIDVQPYSENKEDEFLKGNSDEWTGDLENCYPRYFYNHSSYGKDRLEQLSSYYQYANKLANFSKNLYYDFALDTAGFEYMGGTLMGNNLNDFHNEHIYEYLNTCESPNVQEFYIFVLSKDSFLKNHIKDWSSGTGKGAEQLRDKYSINYGVDLLELTEKDKSKGMSL
jgi:hypothetical protein